MDYRYPIILLLAVILLLSGCPVPPEPNPTPGPTPPSPTPPLIIEPIDLSSISTEKISFTEHYKLEGLEVDLKTSEYMLPLDTGSISNYSDFSSQIALNDNAVVLLEKNGFVVMDNPLWAQEEYITAPYETLKQRDVPIFITSDSLLHLYHIQFDETLRIIEEKEFYDLCNKYSQALTHG